MSDRPNFLKSIDGYLKSEPTKFWKYICSYRKNSSFSVQPDVSGACVIECGEVTELLVRRWKSAYSNSFSGGRGECFLLCFIVQCFSTFTSCRTGWYIGPYYAVLLRNTRTVASTHVWPLSNRVITPYTKKASGSFAYLKKNITFLHLLIINMCFF